MGLTQKLGTIPLAIQTDSSNNVGIGLTPNTWFSGYKVLEMGSGSLVFPNNTTNTQLWNNLFINAAGNPTYKSNGIGGMFSLGGGGNAAVWYTAPSGTAGTTATLTQAMTLTNTGNVGIGTSSPSTKLEVSDANGIPLRIGDISSAPVSQTAGYIGLSTSALNGNNGDLIMIPRNTFNISFWTGATTATERMRITSGGELYWNVTGTGVADIQNGGVLFRNNSNKYVQIITGSTEDRALIYFYKNNGSSGVTLTGSIATVGNNTAYNTTSTDRELKKNFEDLNENILDIFKNSNPQLFNFKTEDDDALKTKGFIAQELYDYFPEAYPIGQDKKHLFNPSGMVIYLMKALKDAAIKIEELSAKVTALENK